MDIRRALSFVKERGDTLERARASTLVELLPAPPEALALLERAQGDDGGWPVDLLAGGEGGVGGTCRALGVFQDLRQAERPSAQRGLQFLLARQESDGGWMDPVPVDAAAPFWLTRGAEAGRLYLTAWVSSLLVAYGRTAEPEATRALDFLLKYQLEGGLFDGFPRHTAWYGLPLLAQLLGSRSGPAQNILLALGRELAEPDWHPATFAALLHNLLLAGYGMETPLARMAWEQLLLRQNPDGGWAGPEGVSDVGSTLEVMRCWRWIVIQGQKP